MTRVIGLGEGRKVNYEYSAFQPLVGFFSYEANEGDLIAIGAYEDDCHNAPKRLPFGFGSSNLPSLEELSGKTAVTSVTWVNEDHGISSNEVEMLDQIIEHEKEVDEKIADMQGETDHIANIDFIDIDINIEINTPVAVAAAEEDAEEDEAFELAWKEEGEWEANIAPESTVNGSEEEVLVNPTL